MKKIWIVVIGVFGLLVVSCSSTENVSKKKNIDKIESPGGNIKASFVNLSISKIYPWLNLMPGKAKKTFNITGEFTVLPGASYDFQVLKLKLIKIYQEGVFLYLIKPTIRQSGSGKKGDLKKILFSTIKGVELIPYQRINKNINIELIFDNNGMDLLYTIPDVKVEKTY